MAVFASPARSTADRLGVSEPVYRGAGVAQLTGAAGLLSGLWLPALGVTAAVCLIALMTGAVHSHARIDDPWSARIPALVVIALTAASAALQLS